MSLTYATILAQVRTWPTEERLRLVQDLLGTLALAPPPPARGTLAQALGLLATDQPPPTDADVARWLNERREERYL